MVEFDGVMGAVEPVAALECDGDVCIRDNESMCRTFDVNDSRLVFGTGELLVRDGDTLLDEIGIDEPLRLVLPSDVSLRKLCAESGRFKLDGVSGFVEIGFCIELGPERPIKLLVLLLRLLLEGGPDGLFEFTKFRPVGGFGAK